ncbi:hypothetical protein BBI09_07145 [Stutzerimonas xanthomarina]|uniref:hypothetical protein n=1 Tax=Stutzerimonas nitrititolerans TaxID=2482751 RepID=UPI000825EE2D|nr:hypothetical protein [Stutzerimonas nitrititolerans]OCX20142.1 hypothetical protein BBI09_07145 [Stutzerimonas xanthomarina]HBB80033.1 hypothetical protein [Pseudomonas sp.]
MNDEEPRQLPTALSVEALTLVTSVLGGAKDGKELLESLGSRIDPARPLRYAVQTCERRDDHILVRVQVRNSGEHGVHVQSLETEETLKADILEVRDITGRNARVGFQSSSDSGAAPSDDPLFLDAGTARLLEVRLQAFDERRLRNAPYGKLVFGYVVNGVARSNLSDEVEFAFPTRTRLLS